MVFKNKSCLLIKHGYKSSVICNGTTYKEFEMLTFIDLYFWIYLGTYTFLVLFSGFLSGLKIAVFSLDILTLKVLSASGKPHEQKYAKRIMPLVKKQHLLLVTFLVCNAAILVSLPILLHKVVGHVISIVVSVTVVLLFAEILPHAIISRYGLALGGIFSPLIFFLMILTFPISWPLSKLLDCLLGSTSGTFFRRVELRTLCDLHKSEDVENEDPLSEDEVTIIKNVLTMRDKVARQVCTPINDLFALNITDNFNQSVVDVIIKNCLFRVPVFSKAKENLLGLLQLKSLIKVNPNDNLPLEQIFDKYKQPLYKVSEDMDLYTVLNFFQLGKSRTFAVVSEIQGIVKKPELLVLNVSDKVLGTISLKDVIHELVQPVDSFGKPVNQNVKKRIFVGKVLASRQCINKQRILTLKKQD